MKILKVSEWVEHNSKHCEIEVEHEDKSITKECFVGDDFNNEKIVEIIKKNSKDNIANNKIKKKVIVSGKKNLEGSLL